MAVAGEELAFGDRVARVGTDEQAGDLVDEVDVLQRHVELVWVHCAPSVPQEEFVSEAVRKLAEDLRVHERLALQGGVVDHAEATDVEGPGTVPVPDLRGGQERTVR